MKLEEQVCSLELAKRLKELGINQPSLFYWVNIKITKNISCMEVLYNSSLFAENPDITEIYNAFTVAELGEMLPQLISSMRLLFPNNWLCTPIDGEHCLHFDSYADTEADARAKMLIYLIENGLIKEKEDATSQREEGEQ
jgi:hypothetical protein